MCSPRTTPGWPGEHVPRDAPGLLPPPRVLPVHSGVAAGTAWWTYARRAFAPHFPSLSFPLRDAFAVHLRWLLPSAPTLRPAPGQSRRTALPILPSARHPPRLAAHPASCLVRFRASPPPATRHRARRPRPLSTVTSAVHPLERPSCGPGPGAGLGALPGRVPGRRGRLIPGGRRVPGDRRGRRLRPGGHRRAAAHRRCGPGRARGLAGAGPRKRRPAEAPGKRRPAEAPVRGSAGERAGKEDKPPGKWRGPRGWRHARLGAAG